MLDLPSGIADCASLDHLRKPNLGRWLFGAAGDWAVIFLALAAAGNAKHPVSYLLAVWIVGTRQHALTIVGHDGAHGMASRNHKLNDFLTNLLCFWPMGSNLDGFRRFHFAHHRLVGTTHDPELLHRKSSAEEWVWPLSVNRLLCYVLKDLAGFSLPEVFKIMYLMRPPTFRACVGPLATAGSIAGLLVLSGNVGILALWYAAMFTSFWAAFRIRIWTEHVGSPGTHRIHLPCWAGWIVAPHNTWYHWEHHRWPSIPYWNLPKARALDRAQPVVSFKDLTSLQERADEPAKSPCLAQKSSFTALQQVRSIQ